MKPIYLFSVTLDSVISDEDLKSHLELVLRTMNLVDDEYLTVTMSKVEKDRTGIHFKCYSQPTFESVWLKCDELCKKLSNFNAVKTKVLKDDAA